MQLRNFTNVFLLTLTANLANGRVDTCLESLWYHNTNSGWSTFLANLAEFFADVRASCRHILHLDIKVARTDEKIRLATWKLVIENLLVCRQGRN